ncbi:hypothetical protein PBAC_32090 [Pedobacter glucosidilyticus]|nr:hypothetical protein [Pedobacter glucosidilyticus]KHJ36620.1 hypothetical protein PBAC_32090 [Pedobacter glucosidilyticus]
MKIGLLKALGKYIMKTISLLTCQLNYTIILFSVLLLVSSCKDECEEPETVFTSTLALDFFDRNSNDFLIKESSSKFTINDIKLYNEFGENLPLRFEINILPEMPDKKYYRVSYGELFKTGDPMFAEVNKRLFIDFNNDRDTIDYTLKTRSLECGSTFEFLKVKYNGVSAGDVENTTFIGVKIIKN